MIFIIKINNFNCYAFYKWQYKKINQMFTLKNYLIRKAGFFNFSLPKKFDPQCANIPL